MSKEMTVREAGRLGGAKRRDSGADYAALGRKGGSTTRDRHGHAHYVECGRRGGEAVKQEHGPEFFRAIGRKGGQRVRELIARGKRSEGE